MNPTEELFRDDATLLRCSATVIAVGEGGVILDRTVCYPLGGGQAGDSGWLSAGDRRWRVGDTRKSKESPGGILHLIEGEPPAPCPIPEFTMHQRRTRGAQGFRHGGWQANGNQRGGNGFNSRPGRPGHGHGQGQGNGPGPHRHESGGRSGRRHGPRNKRSR